MQLVRKFITYAGHTFESKPETKATAASAPKRHHLTKITYPEKREQLLL